MLDFLLDSIGFFIGIPLVFLLFYFQVHMGFVLLALILLFMLGAFARHNSRGK